MRGAFCCAPAPKVCIWLTHYAVPLFIIKDMTSLRRVYIAARAAEHFGVENFRELGSRVPLEVLDVAYDEDVMRGSTAVSLLSVVCKWSSLRSLSIAGAGPRLLAASL